MLHNSLGKNYSESTYFIYCKGVRNRICSFPISGEKSKLQKMSKEQFSLVEEKILETLEKGAIQKVAPV